MPAAWQATSQKRANPRQRQEIPGMASVRFTYGRRMACVWLSHLPLWKDILGSLRGHAPHPARPAPGRDAKANEKAVPRQRRICFTARPLLPPLSRKEGA